MVKKKRHCYKYQVVYARGKIMKVVSDSLRVEMNLGYIPLHCDFQPYLSHGTHNLVIKILQHTKKGIFCRSDKKKI